MIDRFDGEYRFLSNFYPANVTFEDMSFPSVEHAYVAAKTLDRNERVRICYLTTGAAKRYGRTLKLRPDWEDIKIEVMGNLVLQKFTRHPHLKKMLLATGDQELVEGNHWGDTFWGVCKGKGQNVLGRILMLVRAELSS